MYFVQKTMKKVIFNATSILGAVLRVTLSTVAFLGATSAECIAENWKVYPGKPCADGTVIGTPLGSRWRPNLLWGADDKARSTNWYAKPDVIKRVPSGGVFGVNTVVWNDDFVSTVISQFGTQFDGRGHIGAEIRKAGYKNNRRWYNGRTAQEMNSTSSLQKIGI
jgi:hypothetical protein